MGRDNEGQKARKVQLFVADKERRRMGLPLRAAAREELQTAPFPLVQEPVEACDTTVVGSDTEPDPMAEAIAEIERKREALIKDWASRMGSPLEEMPIYFKVPKYPVMLLTIPTRLRGQTLSAKFMQKPTAFRVKPKSGFVEVEVPVPTYKHQRPDISKNYGAVMELRKKHPDDLSCGLSGGFTSASDGKDKGKMGNLGYEELYHSYNECVGEKFQTQIYEGRIQPIDLEGPIEMLAIFKGHDIHLVPIFARVVLRVANAHLDLFRELEDVKQYSEARGDTYEPRDGEGSGESGDEGSSGVDGSEDVAEFSGAESDVPSGSEASVKKDLYKEDTPELPGHDAEYPATDYADTEDDEQAKKRFAASVPRFSEAKDVNLSVKSADDKADERSMVEKFLDGIEKEKWRVCDWIDEDDPRSREFFKTNFDVDEVLKKQQLTSMMTEEQYRDILSAPRFDATRGVMKQFFSWEHEDFSATSDDESETSSSGSELA